MEFFANKKKRFIFIGAIILLVLALTVVLIIKNRGIQDGFKFNIRYGSDLEASPPVACAYKTQERVFNIDNVTFEFYYGRLSQYNYKDNDDYICAETYCKNPKGEKIQLKYITETVSSEKYSINTRKIHKLFYYTLKYDFNYYETIKIPREVFIGDSGYFCVTFDVQEENGNELNSQTIYYRVNGDKVELSTKEFK